LLVVRRCYWQSVEGAICRLVFVFDLDGVVYRGDTAVPGAADALHRLATRGDRLYYLTNNSTRSRRQYAAKLTRLGIPTAPEQVMTSAYATGLHLQAMGAEGRTVFVLGEEGLAEEMRLAGLQVVPEAAETPADFVVVGLNRELTYGLLSRAHWHVTHGAMFIATNRDGTFPLEEGVEIPGGGAVVAALEASAGPALITIGKPEPYTWQHILELAGAAPRDAVMVGDRPETDVLGARRVGLRTVLVLTGVAQPEHLADLPADQRPDHVLPSLADLPELFDGA
jgi:4-nitrophenyl phosphatase